MSLQGILKYDTHLYPSDFGSLVLALNWNYAYYLHIFAHFRDSKTQEEGPAKKSSFERERKTGSAAIADAYKVHDAPKFILSQQFCDMSIFVDCS